MEQMLAFDEWCLSGLLVTHDDVELKNGKHQSNAQRRAFWTATHDLKDNMPIMSIWHTIPLLFPIKIPKLLRNPFISARRPRRINLIHRRVQRKSEDRVERPSCPFHIRVLNKKREQSPWCQAERVISLPPDWHAVTELLDRRGGVAWEVRQDIEPGDEILWVAPLGFGEGGPGGVHVVAFAWSWRCFFFGGWCLRAREAGAPAER